MRKEEFESIEDYNKYSDGYDNAVKYQRETYGCVGWYDYNLKTLGVKWDANFEGICSCRSGEILCVSFDMDTAWDAPIEWVREMSRKFKDVKIELPIKYNMLNEYWFNVRYSLISWEYEQQILDGQKNPVIIHFTCIPKPWYKNCKHPYKKMFDKYKSMSLWSNVKEKHWLRIKYLLEHFFIKTVVFIGLRKHDYIIENRYIKL